MTVKEAVEFWLDETKLGRLVRNQFDDITIDDREEPINIFIADHTNKYNDCMSINSDGCYKDRRGADGICLWLKDCYEYVVEEMEDNINHPNRYCQNGLECIDVIKAFTADLKGEAAFCAGNAIKYILRFHHKNGKEDLEKAKWYINRLEEVLYSDESCDSSGSV